MASHSCVAPPPGLEAEALPPAFGPWAPTGFAAAEARAHPGPWASAVLEACPRLGVDGLRRALDIVDRATRNAQHIKALDELIGAADPSEMSWAPYLQSTACLRAQVSEEQLQLFGELQFLGIQEAGLIGALGVLPAHKAEDLGPPVAAEAAVEVAPCAVEPGPRRKAAANSQRAWERPQSQQQLQSLSASLQALSSEDPECLLIVRRISKLGFKASSILERHFSAYGAVKRVYVAHSTVRPHGPDSQARRRPSSLGFLQMASAKAARAVLAVGAEQRVAGAAILVQKFERQQPMAIQDEEAQLADDAKLVGWPVQAVVRKSKAMTAGGKHIALERSASAGSEGSCGSSATTGVSEERCPSKGSGTCSGTCASPAGTAESDWE